MIVVEVLCWLLIGLLIAWRQRFLARRNAHALLAYLCVALVAVGAGASVKWGWGTERADPLDLLRSCAGALAGAIVCAIVFRLALVGNGSGNHDDGHRG